MSATVDPFTLEVIRNMLSAIAEVGDWTFFKGLPGTT